MTEKIHSGELYLPGDKEIMQEQLTYLDMLFEYNSLRPSEQDKKAALLKKMLAEIGENCYIGYNSVYLSDIPESVKFISQKMLLNGMVMLLLGTKTAQNFITHRVNKKSEQKSAINGLATAIVSCYINLNFTDSGYS